MDEADGAPRWLEIEGRRIAYRHLVGAGPTLVFLPGYRSDMSGSKATALFAWAEQQGRSALLFDYSGCGLSGGTFAEGTLGRWRDEALALIDAFAPGRVLLVGSSMGGWIMLLAALALPAERVAGLVGIAAAPDFTDWGFDADQQARLRRGEAVYEENPYGPEPTPTYPGFWADGQNRLLLGGTIPLDGPVRLLHGLADSDVPYEIGLRLARHLRSGDVQLTLVKDGDHRLSGEAERALILRTIAPLLGEPPTDGWLHR